MKRSIQSRKKSHTEKLKHNAHTSVNIVGAAAAIAKVRAVAVSTPHEELAPAVGEVPCGDGAVARRGEDAVAVSGEARTLRANMWRHACNASTLQRKGEARSLKPNYEKMMREPGMMRA